MDDIVLLGGGWTNMFCLRFTHQIGEKAFDAHISFYMGGLKPPRMVQFSLSSVFDVWFLLGCQSGPTGVVV